MTQTVRIDRDAFRRGVEDVMTFAPLREAVRTAGGVFVNRREKDQARRNKSSVPETRDTKANDGNSPRD